MLVNPKKGICTIKQAKIVQDNYTNQDLLEVIVNLILVDVCETTF